MLRNIKTKKKNRLYTITGQVAAGEAAEKYGKEVETIVKSFVPPATRV